MALNRFVLFFAVPPVMFVFNARADIGDILNGPFIFAILLGALATGIVALVVVKFVFRRDLAQTTFHGFLSIYTNSGYIGIPLFMAAFGADKMLPTIIITTTEPMMFIAVVMHAMERMRYPDKPTLGRIWSVAFMLMKRSMLVVSVLGVMFSAYSIPLPISNGYLLDLLLSSSGPVAFSATGLSLIGHSLLEDLVEIFWF